MAYIDLEEGVPGIRSLALYSPETGEHLYNLVQLLLRGESPLTEAERELIAAFVSYKNNCHFCTNSHAAASRYLYHGEAYLVDEVLNDYMAAPISDKLKTLLTIALHVQQDARTVSTEDISNAKIHGADDRTIHDTVLIAATFCLFNRYVDGLATLTPTDQNEYTKMGERMGTIGYVLPKSVI